MSGQSTFRPFVRRRGASVRLWAVGASVALHLLALGVLGVFHFARSADAEVSTPADISIHTIKRVVEQSEPKPKPKIEPVATPVVQPPRPEPTPPQPKAEIPAPKAAEPAPRPVETTLFFGAETAAGRVCYVVDGSGSMFGLMYLVRQQLRESILKLSPEQSFNVVFVMQDGQLLQAFEGRLAAATPAAKADALNLLAQIRPEGQTSAEQGLAAAMRLRDASRRGPEVIFFLTDGFDLMGGAGEDFVRRITQLRNALAPSVVLHTVDVYPDRHDSAILSRLAETTGGRYTEVNE